LPAGEQSKIYAMLDAGAPSRRPRCPTKEEREEARKADGEGGVKLDLGEEMERLSLGGEF